MTGVWEVVTRAGGVDAEPRLIASKPGPVLELGDEMLFEGRRWTVQSAAPCPDPRANGRIVLVPVEGPLDIRSTPTGPTTQPRPART